MYYGRIYIHIHDTEICVCVHNLEERRKEIRGKKKKKKGRRMKEKTSTRIRTCRPGQELQGVLGRALVESLLAKVGGLNGTRALPLYRLLYCIALDKASSGGPNEKAAPAPLLGSSAPRVVEHILQVCCCTRCYGRICGRVCG